MKILIKDAVLVLPDKIKKKGYVVCKDGVITGLGTGRAPEDCYDKVYSLDGKYLAPGFIDLHIHGAAGAEFVDGTKEAYLTALRTHLKGGTTTVFPTFSSEPVDVILKAVKVYNDLKDEESAIEDIPHLGGLHMEGPNFAPAQAGAQNPDVIHPPVKEEYETILAATPHIKRWAVACELEGAMEFGDYLAKKGIQVSIGHSDATSEQVDEAVKHGYTSVTHLYSGCSMVHRNGPFREGGVVEGAFLNDSLYAEIIADGAHLPKELLKLIVKVKGPDRIALVTDCIRCGGEDFPDGTVIPYDKERGIDVTIERSVAVMPGRKSFAGSLATTSHLVRTMVTKADVSLSDAVKMMTLIPARIMGMDGEIGSLKVGKKADFTVLDTDLQVTDVFLCGRLAYSKN